MSGVFHPFNIVEFDANTWALVYANHTTNNVDYATSPKSDPHNWTKATADNPIISPVSGAIRGGSVIKDGSTYYLLYDTVGQICLASGSALNSLTKHDAGDAPVFSGQGTGWEQFVRHPTLIKVGSTYHMFYDGRDSTADGTDGDIGHATSSDLITWTRDPDNPVIRRGPGDWEWGDVGAPGIVLFNGTYYLFYAGYDNSGAPFPHWIGYAVSNDIDGPWTKVDTNPVLSPGGTGEFDDDHASGPIGIELSGKLVVYYSGVDAGAYAIGYAEILP